MVKLSDFGKAVKIRLMDLGETQSWLIEQVRERTGDYFDSSYLYRLMTARTPGETGLNGKPGKVEIICEILGIEKDAQ